MARGGADAVTPQGQIGDVLRNVGASWETKW
jgi:hypothetical protein